MAQRRKKSSGEHEEGPSAERWLLTYSDMITLLMVLFIVLFAMGQTDIRKFNAFKDSFHQLVQTNNSAPSGGPGVLQQPSAIMVMEENPFAKLNVPAATALSGGQAPKAGEQSGGEQLNGHTSSAQGASSRLVAHVKTYPGESKADVERATLENAERAMQAALAKAGLSKEVAFTTDQRGLVVTILTDKVLFPLDSAQLQPEGTAIIDALAPVLAVLPNQVDVEGDTDNQAIRGGPYASNWALSAARAVAVVEVLINDHGIEPDRLQATGNSDTRPVVPNNTPQHQAENRRVEIVVFSTTVVTP
jgi:chemotaxis protein MotB